MGNITENRLNQTLSEATVTEINNAIAQVNQLLPEGSLTDDQRNSLKSIDVDNKVFVEDALNELQINGSGIIPAFVSAQNITNDLTLFNQLEIIESGLNTLAQKVSDLKRIVGDEAYTGGLTIYRLFEGANNAGINQAKQSYEKLKVRFVSQRNVGRPVETEI